MKCIDLYKKFETFAIEKGARWCFDNSYKIAFMGDVCDALIWLGDYIGEEDVADIVQYVEDEVISLDELYNDFLNTSYSFDNWEELMDFFMDEIGFCKELEKRKTME